jgi:hypothetical protein
MIYGRCEMMHVFGRLLEQVQGKTESAPAAYARE